MLEVKPESLVTLVQRHANEDNNYEFDYICRKLKIFPIL